MKKLHWRILSWMNKSLVPYIIGIALMSAVGLTLQISMSNLLKTMFDAIALARMDQLWMTIQWNGGMILLLSLLAPLCRLIVDYTVTRTVGHIRMDLLRQILRLPMHYFKENHSGDLISRMNNDMMEIEKAYSQTLVNMAVQVIIGLGTAVYMFALDWHLATISIVTGICTVGVNTYFTHSFRRMSKAVQEGLAQLTEKLSDLLAGIQVIRNFNLNQLVLGKYYDVNQVVYQVYHQRVKVTAVLDTLMTFLGTFGFIILIITGAILSTRGIITFGVVLGVAQLQNGTNQLFRSLGFFINGIQSSFIATGRLAEVLDAFKEPEQLAGRYEAITHNMAYAIGFENVEFAYNEERTVLQHLSFTVEQGQMCALVGPSGGGKSTIFKLLMGYYAPTRGNVMINGKSIFEQKVEAIRQQIAYVPQDTFLFAGTIAENIGYGKENATMDEIIQVARLANAYEFISKMEKGFDTLVGEKGTHLSGGERQRIAIARAILKDAPILLLDEATSALDSESEYLVQEALEQLIQGRTTLIIAHRLSTIQNADKIVVIADGKVVEEGSHEELMQEEAGQYRRLKLQSSLAQ